MEQSWHEYEKPYESGEILGWSMRATLSREVVTRQHGRKRPGTGHFAPGANLLLGPTYSGDGYGQVEMIGVKRGSKGRSIIRLLMPTVRVVNLRVTPIYSPSLAAIVEKECEEWWEARHGTEGAQLEKIIKNFASYRNAMVTQASHFYGFERPRHWWIPKGRLHFVDEPCPFCEGLEAGTCGQSAEENPYEANEVLPNFSREARLFTKYDTWLAGWATSRNAHSPRHLLEASNPNADSIVEAAAIRATALFRQRKSATEVLTQSTYGRSPLIGLPIDQAELVAANMWVRTRILLGEDDEEVMHGRVTLRVNRDDHVFWVRAG